MKCSKCTGIGKITNPEWQDEVERLMDGGNYDYDRARKQAARWNNERIACPKCNGTGEVPE